MQYNVERNGYSVVREFVGHGVGRSMHEDPKVPNFVTQEQLRGDFKPVRFGMTIAVEPMVVGRPSRRGIAQRRMDRGDRRPQCRVPLCHTVAMAR